MWDKLALKKTIINTAQKVGITATGLEVNSMQQDKFEPALNYMVDVKQKSSEKASQESLKGEKVRWLSLKKCLKNKLIVYQCSWFFGGLGDFRASRTYRGQSKKRNSTRRRISKKQRKENRKIEINLYM